MSNSPLAIMMPSPLGPLRLVADDDALCGVWFPNRGGESAAELAALGELVELPEAAAEAEAAAAPEAAPAPRASALAILRETARQLREYFAGTRQTFELPLRADGTEFQQRVWLQLREIPFAITRSYGELAAAVGNRNASRAVGAANGKNPIPIIVPCHRVIGADGSLTGFGGGEPAKRWLLDHEARVAGLRMW